MYIAYSIIHIIRVSIRCKQGSFPVWVKNNCSSLRKKLESEKLLL